MVGLFVIVLCVKLSGEKCYIYIYIYIYTYMKFNWADLSNGYIIQNPNGGINFESDVRFSDKPNLWDDGRVLQEMLSVEAADEFTDECENNKGTKQLWQIYRWV